MSYASNNNEEKNSMQEGRRQFIQQFAATGLVFTGLVAPANAGLLDDFGTDPQKIATPAKVVEKPAGTPKRDAEIEPTLKGSK